MVVEGFAVIAFVYSITVLLHIALPAKTVVGYACDCSSGKPLKYHLNGLLVLGVILLCFVFFSTQAWKEVIAENYYSSALAANVVGILGSVFYYVTGKQVVTTKREVYSRCPTKENPTRKQVSMTEVEQDLNRSFLVHFFFGQQFNPRYAVPSFWNTANQNERVFDIKMFLYLVGAVMLALNVYSASFLQRERDGHFLNATIAYTWMFTHFLVEYLYFEQVHLYTYDLFAEKMGFKLFWGCTVFYPFFYAIGTRSLLYHSLADESAHGYRDLTRFEVSALLLCFYAGWVLTRGPNLQKFYFKTDPTQRKVFAGLLEQRTIKDSRILCSGFWGLSRHINYFGETVQSIAISIPPWFVSGSLLPFLYPLYYVLLFTARQLDDDRICLEKYGEKWEQYMSVVPYRIIPFVW